MILKSKFLKEEKISQFTLATNESYKNDKGKVEETQWHRLVAWGKLLILWRNRYKGKEIAIEGKLTQEL
jgi:single-strand DNA-binding protein